MLPHTGVALRVDHNSAQPGLDRSCGYPCLSDRLAGTGSTDNQCVPTTIVSAKWDQHIFAAAFETSDAHTLLAQLHRGCPAEALTESSSQEAHRLKRSTTHRSDSRQFTSRPQVF